jgi:pimeloyl-ACP methyl ester carboxylesterase
MTENSLTYVLIPGAWHGARVWRPVAKRLRAAGHEAIALTMPGLADGDDPTDLGLQDAVDRIVTEVERRDLSQVVLVAHSWGGFPMTGAAHALADRLSEIIYYSAVVPEPGRSTLDDFPPEATAYIRQEIASSPDGTWAPSLELVQQGLMQGESEQAQRLLWELLVPQPGNYGEDESKVPDVTPWVCLSRTCSARTTAGLAGPTPVRSTQLGSV